MLPGFSRDLGTRSAFAEALTPAEAGAPRLTFFERHRKLSSAGGRMEKGYPLFFLLRPADEWSEDLTVVVYDDEDFYF